MCRLQIVKANSSIRQDLQGIRILHQCNKFPAPSLRPIKVITTHLWTCALSLKYYREIIKLVIIIGPPGSNNGGGLATGYSIPAHAQKDERTQRQFMRIRRKLEQKQQAPVPSYNNGASYNNHPASIRKGSCSLRIHMYTYLV